MLTIRKIGIITPTKQDPNGVEQEQALKEYRCDEFHLCDMPNSQLDVIRSAGSQDLIIIHELRHLGSAHLSAMRSLKAAIENGRNLIVLADDVDTRRSTDHKFLNLMLRMHSNFQSERVKTSQARAMEQGVQFGRRHKLTREDWAKINEMLKTHSKVQIAKIVGVSRQTLFKFCKQMEAQDVQELLQPN